jgi:thioredoxin 1
MSNTVLTITDSEFSTEVLDAAQPVLVYFWASWCGPCRLMAPIVESIASQYDGQLKVVKMEVDPNPESVASYSVEGVPAFRIFKTGSVVEASEGAMSRQKLQEFVDAHLSSTV